MKGDGAQPSFQIAVFRYRERDLVAVIATDGSDYGFNFWCYEKKKWKKVTEALST
ncbi:hypothetical protein [Abditibacterium utsteinense]|uniref:hypothetical protein n=1 Tax=Abditibacterium utsteinense TaxID=1960156 RepID=UPI001300A98A|nr:hypothetical protein [Abditibacterium utsteinense]